MRLSVVIGCGLLSVAAVVFGQGSSAVKPADIAKEWLEIIDKLTMQLSGIKDADTAKSSRDELRTSVAQWLDMRKRAEKMKPPTREEKDKIEKEFKGKLATANARLFAEIARIKKEVPGGPEALKEIRDLVEKKQAKKPK